MSAGVPAGSIARAIKAATANPAGGAALELEEYFDELENAIIRLSQEVKELRADSMKFRGAWSSSGEYTRGNVVVHGGQLWHANPRSGTTSRPGAGDDWTLMTKIEASKSGARSLSNGSRSGSRGTGTPR